MTSARHLAFDLGAGSGRAFVGLVSDDALDLEELHRFSYEPRFAAGHLRWNAASLLEGLDAALRRAASQDAGLESVGVDTWGVDYALLDDQGRLLEDPCSYRDARTDGVMDGVLARIPRHELFAATGLQFRSINTLYQLVAHVNEGLPPEATRLLMMPDLCHHWLSGSWTGEETNASTTQLLDASTRQWANAVFARLGLPRHLMPPVLPAGTRLGPLRAERRATCGLGAVPVVAPATHDTASAVVGTPLQPGWAYVSSGTWSLIGVERESPLITPETAAANFTNEAGVGGSVRLLTNVMGLWILEGCRREWRARGDDGDLERLITGAASLERCDGYIDPDAPRFLHPQRMAEEVRAALRESRQIPSDDPIRLTRVILDSLACRYACAVDTLESLTGAALPGIHIVGGGSRNRWLNQATANAAGRPVVAGPVEATAAGNVIVQAIAMGTLPSLAEGRRRVARTARMWRYEPADAGAWREARQRFAEATA